MASDNLKSADNDLANHPNLASDMHVTANDLRAGYKAALATNPNLKFGQYVAATRLAQNLGGRFPNITRAAILAGLANGDSIGKTLQNLGLSKDQDGKTVVHYKCETCGHTATRPLPPSN